MRTYLVVLMLSLMLISCRSTQSSFSGFYQTKKVSLNSSGFEFDVETRLFSNELADSLIEEKYIEESADVILTEIINGYENQLFNVERTSEEESNIVFKLKKLTIKQGYFTINFPNPGPIYRVFLEVDIFERGELIATKEYKSRVNMSEINFAHLPFKWLDEEERNNPEYQLATLQVAVKNIFQKLYFNYFDISLSI